MIRFLLFLLALVATAMLWPFVLVGFIVWFAWRVARHLTS